MKNSCCRHDEEDPHHDRLDGDLAPLLVGDEAVSTDRLTAVVLQPGDVLELRVGPVPAVVPDDALVGVDQDDEGGVEHGEDQVECQAHEEKLSHFEPLEMEKTLTERMFEEMIMSGLDKGHEHCAFSSTFVWYQNFVI